ncbi:MAG TPA: DUF502 domain-containing protein [Rhizomicrobium sp.]|jgi:uncharacterized membrane protein
MTQARAKRSFLSLNLRNHLIAGLLTIVPLIVVWLVFDFLLGVLFEAGRPLGLVVGRFLGENDPALRPWLADARVQWLVAVLAALAVLYAIGAIASRVIGKRLIALFERVIARIPFVQSVYSAAKTLVGALQQKPEGSSRVVLIEFPHPGLRTIGFVMRTFRDAQTDQDLAAVLVPTAPNPSTGYLAIAPVASLTHTDISVEQAMAMILSGGANTPERISVVQR